MTEGALEGRHAIVFGGGATEGASNGSAAAILFARAGARVSVVDYNPEAARKVTQEIEQEGHAAVALRADVTDAADVDRVVAEASEHFGPIGILHNNVGVTRPGGVTEVDPADWDFVLRTNLTSAYLTMRHVLPRMIKAGQGAVINVSSLAAIRHTGYDYAAYSASKAALNQLTRVTAREHARHGIRVNVIMPGMVDTLMARREIAAYYDSEEEMLALRNAAVPIGQMATPWDIGRAAVFLASDNSAQITGHCLPVDGGLSLGVGMDTNRKDN